MCAYLNGSSGPSLYWWVMNRLTLLSLFLFDQHEDIYARDTKIRRMMRHTRTSHGNGHDTITRTILRQRWWQRWTITATMNNNGSDHDYDKNFMIYKTTRLQSPRSWDLNVDVWCLPESPRHKTMCLHRLFVMLRCLNPQGTIQQTLKSDPQEPRWVSREMATQNYERVRRRTITQMNRDERDNTIAITTSR